MNSKKLYLLLITLCTFCSTLFCTETYAKTPAGSDTCFAASSWGISPLADDIRWRYKIVNGVLYKRQYNSITKEWIVKWVKALKNYNTYKPKDAAQ